MKILDRLKLWFPTVKKYQIAADKAMQEAESLKTLTFNGDTQWFIDQCRQHRDEVCNDDKTDAV